MKNLKSLFPYLLRYKWHLGLGVVFIFLSNLFAVFAPQVVRHAIDVTMHHFDPSAYSLKEGKYEWMYTLLGSTVLSFAFLIFFIAIIRGLFLFLMRQTIIVMSRKVEYDQKQVLYAHYQKLSLNFYKKNNTGDLMNRITEDISRVRMFSGPTIMYTLNLLSLFIVVVFTMWQVNHTLTLYCIIPIPIMGVMIFFVNHIIEKKSEKIQQQLSGLTTFTQEAFSGIRLIKSYVQEKQMNHFFSREAELYRKKNLSLAKVESIYFPVIFILVGLSNLLTIFIGGRLAIEGKISHGNIAEFILYINMLTWPMASVGWVMALAQRAAVSQKRFMEFLETKPEIISGDYQSGAPVRGEIEFKNVSFVYPNTGTKALQNISFHLMPGQKLGIVGMVGSGKTALAQLLVRAYDVTEGVILLDGIDIRKYSLHQLRNAISYVPQDVFLFSETVAENIRFGKPDASMEDVEQAASEASVTNDISMLPAGFETIVGERGVTLSGGQKQRVSLARALVKNSPVIMLDDCLSAVDAATESNILNSLRSATSGKTTLFITHRISSLLNFDQILVLEQGHIAESGTHEALMKKEGIYHSMYKMQQVEMAPETAQIR